jgi:hypothetical protein
MNYDLKKLPFMRLNGEQHHITETDVSVPPALTITDERGDVWTIGFQGGHVSRGEFVFDVVRNGLPTGEFANRIEKRNGRVRIFGPYGFKRWTGNQFV